MNTQRPTLPQNMGVVTPTPKIDAYVFSALPQFSLLTGIQSPCIDPGWPSCASFPFWWQTRSSPCKHIDYAGPCILSCCYMEFTSLAYSIVTKELYTSLLLSSLKL